MREIKFRAWDKKENKMIDNFHETYMVEDINRYDLYHVMQYSEVKDKNGKEIYEGDIIIAERTTHSGEPRGLTDGIWGYVGIDIIGTIEWDIKLSQFLVKIKKVPKIDRWAKSDNYSIGNDKDMWKYLNNKKPPTGLILLNNIEILGNIYENPELLKEVK